MNLVYVLGNKSLLKDFELLQSLRSVRKYVTGFGRVIVVGDTPRFDSCPDLPPFEHIPDKDVTNSPIFNVTHKLTHNGREFPGRFVLLNDDIFFLKPCDMQNGLPNYSSGDLRSHAEQRGGDDYYARTLLETADQLEARGFTTFDFENHVPMVMDWTKLVPVVATFDWSKEIHPQTRSLYGNFYRLPRTRLADCKINEPVTATEIERRTQDAPFLSVGDGAFNGGGMFEWLKARFN